MFPGQATILHALIAWSFQLVCTRISPLR